MRDLYRCVRCQAFTEEPVHCSLPSKLLLKGEQRERLSRLMSAILRHAAPSYGVSLNREGWAKLSSLLKAVRQRAPWITEEHLQGVAACDPKGRFEVRAGLVRARYGHSLPVAPSYVEDLEVGRLYHGTTADRLASILSQGLKPMRRRMVHLSPSLEEAFKNASRWRRRRPVVVVVDAERLRSIGLKIYKASPTVYLVEEVPPSCIVEVVEEQGFKQVGLG